MDKIKEFQTWLRVAKPGAKFLYHVGDLKSERVRLIYTRQENGTRTVAEERVFPLDGLANLVWSAFEAGRVLLVQQRVQAERRDADTGSVLSKGAFAYFAIKPGAFERRRGAMADEVKSGFQRIAQENWHGR